MNSNTHCYLLTNAGSYNLRFFFQSSYSDMAIKLHGEALKIEGTENNILSHDATVFGS